MITTQQALENACNTEIIIINQVTTCTTTIPFQRPHKEAVDKLIPDLERLYRYYKLKQF